MLTEQDDGTRVEQTIDLSRSAVPRLWRVVIGLIARFGTSVGETYLETLKREVETRPRRR